MRSPSHTNAHKQTRTKTTNKNTTFTGASAFWSAFSKRQEAEKHIHGFTPVPHHNWGATGGSYNMAHNPRPLNAIRGFHYMGPNIHGSMPVPHHNWEASSQIHDMGANPTYWEAVRRAREAHQHARNLIRHLKISGEGSYKDLQDGYDAIDTAVKEWHQHKYSLERLNNQVCASLCSSVSGA